MGQITCKFLEFARNRNQRQPGILIQYPANYILQQAAIKLREIIDEEQSNTLYTKF